VLLYEKRFWSKDIEVLDTAKFPLNVHGVAISDVPELYA